MQICMSARALATLLCSTMTMQAALAKKATGKRPAPGKAAKSPQKRQKRQPASGRKASRKVVDSSGESSGDEEEEEDEDDDDSNFTG